MKWKSEKVWTGRGYKWKLGIKDTILSWLMGLGLILLAVGIILFDKIRFNF